MAMRTEFCSQVENGRVRDGVMASPIGDRNGAFLLKCHITNDHLTVIISDGKDWKNANLPGEPWEHVSVSLRHRCPRWDEMEWVRGLFFEDHETVMQLSVPRSAHVNDHPYALHMWRPTVTPIPLPPSATVGLGIGEAAAREQARKIVEGS